MLDRCVALHPQVAVRPEPFGALAYHYGNRRLIFLKHPDLVRVVNSISDHDSVRGCLVACGIAESRWSAFGTALESLIESEMLHERSAG
jgi:mycofactocin biosynthesis protein MftB